MKITVHEHENRCDVSLLTEALEIDLAVRFDAFEEAKDFADLWAEWIGCDTVEVIRSLPKRNAA